jgi:hypothetical protein
MTQVMGQVTLGIAVAGLVLTTSVASGQDCEWLPGEGMPGTNGAVWAMTTWDPDGAGP